MAATWKRSKVIEPTTECIIDCVVFFMNREKGGGTTGIKTNLVVGSTDVKSA